jgi:hypothetical protein
MSGNRVPQNHPGAMKDLLPTPINFPELAVAAGHFRQAVKAAKTAGHGPAARRLAIKQAEAAYHVVFGRISRRLAERTEEP